MAPAPVGDTLATSSSVTLVSMRQAASTFADAAREALGFLRFQVGVGYDLGRATAHHRREPAEPPDTTSPPAR